MHVEVSTWSCAHLPFPSLLLECTDSNLVLFPLIGNRSYKINKTFLIKVTFHVFLFCRRHSQEGNPSPNYPTNLRNYSSHSFLIVSHFYLLIKIFLFSPLILNWYFSVFFCISDIWIYIYLANFFTSKCK